MALAVEAAALNAEIDQTLNAMETYIESLSAGDKIMIAPAVAIHNMWQLDSAIQYAANGPRVSTIMGIDNTNPSPVPMLIGGFPLWWKVTNSAGDLS